MGSKVQPTDNEDLLQEVHSRNLSSLRTLRILCNLSVGKHINDIPKPKTLNPKPIGVMFHVKQFIVGS